MDGDIVAVRGEAVGFARVAVYLFSGVQQLVEVYA